MRELDIVCEKHAILRNELRLSPPKFNCKQCKKRCVHGHTNPDHGSNPFGYLYLVPNMCVECSIQTQKCMWCD